MNLSAGAAPIVSVILSVRQGSRAVDRTIASVLRQSETSWELIAVDERSADHARERLPGWPAGDGRVRVLWAGPSSGRAAALNLGLRHSSAPMVAYLDAGDEYYPDYLERVARFTGRGDVLISAYDYLERREGLGPRFGTWDPTPLRDSLFLERPAILLGVAHRRDFWGRVEGFDESLREDEDWDLCKRMARAGAEFLFLPLRAGLYHLDELLPRPASAEVSGESGVFTEASIPKRLGDYRILRELGRGGRAVVYEATPERGGRHRALKALPLSRLDEPGARERFCREAATAARMEHPNIVPVLELGEHEGIPYFVMPLIRGCGLDQVASELGRLRDAPGSSAPPLRSLAAGLARALLADRFGRESAANGGPSGWPALYRAIAGLGVQAAGILEHVHRRGVIHRDIKPSNFLIDARGRIRLIDFGLARLLGEGDEGVPVGTPKYMSPEQRRGAFDRRSDIFGLGMTLYELTIPGRPEHPLPRRLEATLLRSIAQEPGDRHATASDLASDLARFLAG